MKKYFQKFWEDQRPVIVLGAVLFLLGIAGLLLEGQFIDWIDKIVRGVSPEMVSIGFTLVIIDGYSYYKLYSRNKSVLSDYYEKLGRTIFLVRGAIENLVDVPLNISVGGHIGVLEYAKKYLYENSIEPGNTTIYKFQKWLIPELEYLIEQINQTIYQVDDGPINDSLNELHELTHIMVKRFNQSIEDYIEIGKAGLYRLEIVNFLRQLIATYDLLEGQLK